MARRPHPCSVRHLGPFSLVRRVLRRAASAIQSFTRLAQTSVRIPLMVCLVPAMMAQNSGQSQPPATPAPEKPAAAKSSSATPSSSGLGTGDPVELVDPRFAYSGVPADLPQDQGAAGLRLALRRLGTTARLMQVVAHRDDEDGGMLTLEARGHGVSALLMTLTRGEGGQNKIGSNLSDVLGVLRALELLASDQYYGVQERFSRVADFGFSKSPDETFSKWGGHDVALADMVRVIRTFRPDVLAARFSGTERDGHGHHQASSILSREAFRAAADPKRFPEQIAQGLKPWQVKKLYIGNVCGFGATTCPDANWTIKLNTGQTNADLGGSYVQFAMQGLRHQLSQGSANWTVEPGDRFTFYKLVDSVEPAKLDKDGHEKDFFDGIDTSLPDLANGVEESKLPKLRYELQQIAVRIAKATESANRNDAPAAVIPLMGLAATFKQLSVDVRTAGLGASAESDLIARLEQKSEQAEMALDLALNVTLQATVVSRVGPNGEPVEEALKKDEDATTTVSPGQEFLVAVDFHNGSKDRIFIDGMKLEVPEGWATISDKTKQQAIKPGGDERVVFRLRVPKNAGYTRPYWHRDDPDTESLNHVDDEKYATLPFPPPVLRARANYSVTNASGAAAKSSIATTVVTEFADDAGKPSARPLAVVPAFSVALEPGTQVISTHNGTSTTVTVGVTSNLTHEAPGMLQLELPVGWRSEPGQLAVHFARRGDKQDFRFKVFPAGLQEGRAKIRAVLEAGGDKFSEGYTLVTREDLGSFYYYQPAVQREHGRCPGAT